MLRLIQNSFFTSNKSSSFQGAFIASGIMAFAGLGDALLYSVLPVYGASMGFSVFLIGVLLSVNRFVRIIANTHIANIVRSIGMKKVLLISSSFAVLTTLVYGLKLGIVSFFLARILWGLSYSGLKISTLNYAAIVKKHAGLAFGISQSIKSLGAFFILIVGPILIGAYGIEIGFFMIASISSVGVFLAFLLPEQDAKQGAGKVKTATTFAPTPINLLVFILAFTIDGILVVVLSDLFLNKQLGMNELLVYISFYLLLKRLFVLIFSFISGFLSLKISTLKMFNAAILFCIAAIFLIAFNYTVLGIVVAFLFNTIIVTFAPLIAIEIENQNTLQSISGTSTWWDLGAAIGAFSGIFLIKETGSFYLFFTLGIVVIILFFNFFIQYGNTNQRTI